MRQVFILVAAVLLLGTGAIAQSVSGSAYDDYKPDKQPGEIGKTSVEIDGVTYGATDDELGRIGGGEGYKRIVRTGDFVTSTVQGVMAALKKAKPGQTVFIPGDAVLDMTTWILADKLMIDVPGGVTLASDRGTGGSEGALIFSDEMNTQSMIRILGDGARVTGLRLRGPDPLMRLDFHRRCFSKGGPGHALYYKMPNSRGIRVTSDSLEVDNCELMGWSHAAVDLEKGSGHRVHHNSIHHNRRHGLGYGVVLNKSFALIDHNLFDYNRHHIAGTGAPGSGYEAANNVCLTNANSHLFDMHGGRDRKDGTTIAGTWMKVHHNTFMHPTERVMYIRGIPQKQADIHHNWIYRGEVNQTVIMSDGKTTAHDNVYGNPPQKKVENYSFKAKPAKKPVHAQKPGSFGSGRH